MNNRKTTLFLFPILLFSFIGLSQNTYVPDDNFEQALINLGYDSAPLDDYVPTANINTITNLDIPSKNIIDLTGIQDFVALTKLDCNNNNLSSLDVTNLVALQILWCENNQLINIDITKNLVLISLVCRNNQITNIDTSLNSILNVFVCNNNQISTLNISKNTNLNRFLCNDNLLTNLDISNNTNLTIFSCDRNQLTRIDVTKNLDLGGFNCEFNKLTELDISKNSILTKFDCSNNNLCKLNLKNGNNNNITNIDFSSNLNLNCIVVDNPSGNHTGWLPTSFSNYVNSQNDCNTFVNIDTLNNVLTNTAYILPTLTYGHYFTEPNGKGKQLNPGDSITNSQTIFIYNTSICANNQSSFNVLITNKDYYIPKYFTPNNDGNHDNWQVKDFKNSINKISIFNRNGKLLKSLNPNSNGWNGTYNGNLLRSDDYWFLITLNSGETIKGHFTLKR